MNPKILSMAVLFFVLTFIPSVSFPADTKTPVQSPAIGKSAGPGNPKEGIIDINSATKEQLTTLPEIGEAEAKKIIEGRPYKTKLELIQKKIIPAATYKKIIYKIIVKQK